jgi:hypothetical protein
MLLESSNLSSYFKNGSACCAIVEMGSAKVEVTCGGYIRNPLLREHPDF